ncbi:MAG: 4-alpha-glucanotransferase [Gemmataceae bacterium]
MTTRTLLRSSGLLLHPSSLPGPFGIGDLGTSAYRWVDTLAAMKQSWWQILPLGPTGFGDSPYQSFSAFAGNVNLLSPELLVRDGLLAGTFFAGQSFPADHVDFERVTAAKLAMVREAWDRFRGGAGHLRGEYEDYRHRQRAWLPDYALFMAIRETFGGKPLADWPEPIRTRHTDALAVLEQELADEVAVHTFGQFLFDRQWAALKASAHQKGVRILGDAPIFVAGDSADVWANPDQFLLDDHGKPTAVAGVPPDYFSEDGQLWGNPLYDWDRMEETGFAWWTARLRRNLEQVDLVRLDHFRGFAAAWHVPPTEKTAKNGKWVDGPRAKLFDVLKSNLGSLPIVAEDLGLITDDVHELRQQFAMPGMRVLQFMLGGPDNPYWPHNYQPDTVAYTGTHDNDTTAGWWAGLTDDDRKRVAKYIGHDITEPHWEMIRMAWASVAVLAIAPLQDILGLGREGRMNVPGVADGNWRWRFTAEQFSNGAIERLAEWTERYNRVPAGH